MPQPPPDVQEQKPAPDDSQALAQAIWDFSLEVNDAVNRNARNQKPKTASYTMDPLRDRIIKATGTITITLPPADEADHTEYVIVRVGAGTVTVDTGGGDIIGVGGTASSVTITTDGGSVRVSSDSVDYHRLDNL